MSNTTLYSSYRTSHDPKIKICKNCRGTNHTLQKCKLPMISYGIIPIRINPETKMPEYLMICRKYSLSYLEIIRGNYSPSNIDYIIHMCRQMSLEERQKILDNLHQFYILYMEIGSETEIKTSDKTYQRAFFHFEQVAIPSLLNNWTSWKDHMEKAGDTLWPDPEWGFPKGRRDYHETEIECALREFEEETGMLKTDISIIQNILPITEHFHGSDSRPYIHSYYLAMVPWKKSENYGVSDTDVEIKKVAWFRFEEAILHLRSHQHSRILLLQNIHRFIANHTPIFILTT